MIPTSYWFTLAFLGFLTLVGIESKLGKIADELAVFRKAFINDMTSEPRVVKVWITKMPKE
jgi:hypothetical protein